VLEQQTAQAILDASTGTAARLTEYKEIKEIENANQTATATFWTATLTPDLTQTVGSILTEWWQGTATRNAQIATATANSWTPIPTLAPTQPGSEAIYSAFAGMVIKTFRCSICGSLRSVDAGYLLNDPRILQSPQWAFGLGSYIVLRFDSRLMPADVYQTMEDKGVEDAYIFCLYSHLSSIEISEGQMITEGQLLAYTGYSGNVLDIDLYVECRLSKDPTAKWNATSLQPDGLYLEGLFDESP
jgi:hypothetical protein